MARVVALCLAALWPSPVGGLTLSTQGALDQPTPDANVEDVLEGMMQQPDNLEVQQRGCGDLQTMCRVRPEGIGPWGMPLVATSLLKAGVGNAFTQGLLNILASGEPDSKVLPAATACFNGISSLSVAYNHDRGMILIQTAPKVMQAMVGYLRRFRHNRDVLLRVNMLAGLFGHTTPEATPLVEQAGGFDLVFETLANNASDLELAQACWAAISDNAEGSRAGALFIANHGGPGKGIEFIVQSMREALGKHFLQPGQPYGLQYEIIHDGNGILLYDDTNKTFLQTFLRAGFLEATIKTMRDEPNDRLTQDNCCQAIKWMTDGNATNQRLLTEHGALELLAADLAAFPTTLAGSLFVYSPLHSCTAALLNFAQGLPESRQEMLRLGVPHVLNKAKLKSRFWASPTPWHYSFPYANIPKLQALLMEERRR